MIVDPCVLLQDGAAAVVAIIMCLGIRSPRGHLRTSAVTEVIQLLKLLSVQTRLDEGASTGETEKYYSCAAKVCPTSCSKYCNLSPIAKCQQQAFADWSRMQNENPHDSRHGFQSSSSSIPAAPGGTARWAKRLWFCIEGCILG